MGELRKTARRALRIAARNPLVGHVASARDVLIARVSRQHMEALLPAVAAEFQLKSAEQLSMKVQPSVSDVSVALVKERSGDCVAAVKLARSAAAARDLERAACVCDVLRSDERLGAWRRMIPETSFRRSPDATYLLESAVSGRTVAEVLARQPERAEALCSLAIEAIDGLHRPTAKRAPLDEPLLSSYLEPLLGAFDATGRVDRSRDQTEGALRRLEELIVSSVTGRCVRTSFCHGDYSPGNVFVSSTLEAVVGIVDWGQARSDAFPSVDRACFSVTTYCGIERRQLGHCVVELLSAGSADHPLLKPIGEWAERDGLDSRSLVWMVWLEHVAGNLRKSDRYAKSTWWWESTVAPVLDLLGA